MFVGVTYVPIKGKMFMHIKLCTTGSIQYVEKITRNIHTFVIKQPFEKR